jgi:hypothetical protein
VRPHPRTVAAPLIALALFAGCAGPAALTPSPSADQTSAPSQTSEAPTPEPSEAPATAGPPTETPPAATPPTSPEPPDASASATDSGPGPADECTGTDANRDFYASVAAAVDWTVYCAVLPTGWFVATGEYRLAGGGRMEISYRGPGGARLELHEGAFCADGSGCVPSGSKVGDAAFGDRTGTLVSADDGTWALAVDQDKAIEWLAIGEGVNEAAFRAIAAGLLIVSD